MASAQAATSVFFQLFQAHCGHSDLGQINVNWFEELTREAIRLQPRLLEDEEKRGGQQDNSLFKTPQHKRSLCSQLESTPSIFREQSLCSPLFLSPTKDHEKSHISAENFRNVLATEQSPDSSTMPLNETFGTSSRYLADSPVVMKQLFKAPFGDGKYLHTTPRQDRKFDISDSFLCTPQLIRDQSSRCISESLGVEADPEMSWSSSLATPPSPTVIIAQAKEEVYKPRKYDREDVLIVHSLFSKKNNVAEAVSSAIPESKTDRDSTKFANKMTNENMEKSSDYLKAQQKKTVLNAVGDKEACQVVENAIEGMEDVLSIFFTNEKPPESRKIKRKIKPFSSVTGKKYSLIENTEEQTTTFTSENHKIHSKLLEKKACSREISLSYEWTPLNLPDTAQEENIAVENGGSSNTMKNSACNDFQLHRDEHTSKASNVSNKYGQDGLLNSSQYMEHKEKSEERLPDDAAGDSEPLVSGDLSYFATEGDFPWRGSSIAEQKPKLILSTLKKQNRFLYSLKMDYQQSETTEKIDTTLHGEPSKGLETPEAQSKRSLDLKNTASSPSFPEIKQVEKEDDDDVKDNSIDFKEILEEEAVLNMMQTDPTATSGVKSAVPSVAGNCTELQVAKSENISQIEYEASQHSEGMVAHSNTKARVLDSVTRDQDSDHSVQEDPYTSRMDCDSICSTQHPGKAESKSANKSCDLPVEKKMLSFVGFKTASNKKIHISEDNLRKAELLLKEDKALPISIPAKVATGDKNLMDRTDDTMTHMEFHRASPKEMVTESRTAQVNVLLQEICQNPSKRCKTNTPDQTTTDIKLEQDEMTGSVEPNTSRNLPEVSHEEIKEENKTDVAPNTRKQPSLDSKSIGDIGFKENSIQILNLQGIESHLYEVFTESQKAEINELSSILENAGSQFDFTQVKKLNLLGLDHENMQNPKKSISESQKLNTSDVWRDVDFNDSFANGEENLESNVLCVVSEPENKSDIKTNACDITDNNVGFKRRDGTVGGFTMDSGKSVNITDEDLVKAIEMFDLEEKAGEKMTKTGQDLNCSPRPQTFTGLHVTANDRTATQSVSNVSNTMQATTLPKLAQSKEKYFSDIELYSNQEDKCKSKENHATELQPRKERQSSKRSLPLLVEGVQNCDIASSSYENCASASGLSTMPVGFATGKGKAININKAALDKARTMFSDISDMSDPREDHRRTPPARGPSGLLTNAPQANNTFAEKETHGPRSYHGPDVSNKESKVPKVILDGLLQEENQKLHVLRNESNPLPQDNLISNRSLFSTASGKSLQLSEESLKRAHKMFSDVDEVHVGDQQTGIVSREPTVNSGGLLDLKNKSVLVKETTFNFPHPGFSTANCKLIGVSQKYLQKARELFSDIGEPNDLDVGQRNPSSQNIAQVRRNKPLVNQVTADLCSEILADIPPLDNLPNKEMSNKTSSGEHKIPEMSVMSLSTAGGKSILLSEDSLRKAQGMFTNIDDSLLQDEGKHGSSVNQIERKDPKSTFPPLGFSTASGRAVAVSQSSLQKARQMFAAPDDTVSDTGLTFQSTKSLTRKEDALEPNQSLPISNALSSLKPALNQCTNPKGVDTSMCFPQQETSNRKMAFFSTASGSHVHLSNKALQKAREMFADLDDGQVDQPLQENIKEKAEMMDFSSKNPDNIQRPTMQVNAQGVAPLSVGFNTASGKTVAVSHDSLQKAKLLFADADNSLDPANSSQGNTTIGRNQREEIGGFSAVSMYQTSKTRSSVSNFYSSEGSESRNNTREPVVEDGCIPKMPCFSTAGGKMVTVSKESLKRVREIFSEVDNHCSSQRDANVDVQPNPTSAAKVSLRRNNKEPEPPEIQHSSNVPTKNSFGFSTASGKQVCVSEDALQKVKCFFEEFDTNENLEGNLNESRESARIHTLNPLLNKQHLKDSVTKLDHRQKKTTSTKSSCSSVPPPGLIKHSTPLYGAGSTHLYFTSSRTPENEIEIEAAESTKAFMDDEDLTDAELKADGLFLCSDKLPNIRNGKRLRCDDGMGRGEPPIKRQLLPEFDRSLENDSKPALKPLTSSPHESLKDRRKFFYKTSLQPLSSDPASFSKGKEATLETRHAPPSYPHCKLNGSRSSLPGSSVHVSADCRSDRDNVLRTVTSSFVTPFKKDPHVSSGDQMVNSPRQDQDYSKGLLSKSRMEVGASHKDESGPDFSNLVANICCARDMQEMRIRKKQRQKIKPQPGSLYLQKTSSANRINLVLAVEERQPTVYTQAELYRCGVIKNHIGINSETARTFEFHCLDYFTRERFLSEGGVQIADGGWLVPTDKLSAGREEFYRALCDTPGVDPKLISPEWVYNHYQWIVWKLAAMEVKFPMIFAGRCLTPDRVLLQLKYRYDVEIDKCRRSAVRKIMERDDTPAKTLVLCISKILTLGNCETSDTKQTSAIIEVTDGWYGIKALLDPALTSLLKKGRMFIGQKIIVHGAELVGSDCACTPLEAPDSLMLKIAGNSTRPARWYTKLGYFHDPRPFCLRLSSLLAEGGIVGCVDVLIQRSYPIQWMEKMGNGTYVFRNERAEERAAETHSAKQQKNLEVLYVKIREEYEKEQVSAPKKRPRRQSLSEPQIRALQDGAELYEALQNEPDPSYLESSLSSDQLRTLNHHRQVLNDKRHAQIQAEFRKAIESSEQEVGGSARRDVTPVWKIRVVDYKDRDCTSAYMLNIWRPLPDVVSLLKEGGRFKIYQLAASQSKGKSDTAAVQLTATKKTQFQQLQPLQHILEQIYTERQVTPISHFLEPHFTAAYGEVDVIGLVISTQQKPGAAPLVYLSDETCHVVALKFYTDLGQLALEELTKPHTFIAAANLRWRSEYVSGVPTVFAGDLSFVAANPKEHHLQKAIQKLRQSIESVPEFCKEMENKLMNILQAQNPQERASLSCCSVDPPSHLVAGNRCSTPGPKINNFQIKPMSTPAGSNTVLNTSTEFDPKTCKKMKGLDYLSRIPSPAPLTPVGTLLSPSLQRAFRPPRSLHKEDRTCAKTTPNPDSCTPSKLEGGFVADEELAMINTQALVSGLEGGGKLTSERDIQKKITPNVNCPESGKAQMTEEESRVPYQRRLCRKRKQKP